MESATHQIKNQKYKTKMSLRITPWDICTGFPAGALIFIGTVLLNTLCSLYTRLPFFAPIAILASVSLIIGWLAGITRLRHGPATALTAGLITAGILCYLWLAARQGDQFDQLVIGPLGMLVTIVISPIGGWLGAKQRRAI
jgi:hypothetical protein